MQTENTNCYKGLYGLSCAENNVLMYLKEYYNDITWLYADSEVSIKNLIQCFLYRNQKYNYFDGFPQIHTKLKKLGVLSIEMKNGTIEQCFNDMKTNEDVLYLFKMKPVFFNTMCNIAPRKDDYYIYSKFASDNKYIILKHDEPFFEIIMEKNKIEEIFTGQFIKIKKLREINKDDERLFKRQYKKAEVSENWRELYIPGMEYMSDIFTKLSDMIKVYLISRRRRQIYESSFKDTGYMDNALDEIEKLYIYISQITQKDISFDSDAIYQIVKSLWETDIKIN